MLVTNLNDIRNLISNKSLLVFDFDGVVSDSVEVKTDAFAKLYHQHGSDIVKQVVQHHRCNGGMSRFEKITYYHKKHLGKKISASELNDLSRCFSKMVVDSVISAPEILGIRSFLDYHCGQGKYCVVNSATPQEEIIDIVNKKGLGKYFSSVVGSPTSKVDNLLLLLDQMCCMHKDAVFFGDSHSDFIASNKLCIDFVGVGNAIIPYLDAAKGMHYQIENFIGIYE